MFEMDVYRLVAGLRLSRVPPFPRLSTSLSLSLVFNTPRTLFSPHPTCPPLSPPASSYPTHLLSLIFLPDLASLLCSTPSHLPMDGGTATVCSMCGDIGFPDKLFRCARCRYRFQHS